MTIGNGASNPQSFPGAPNFSAPPHTAVFFRQWADRRRAY